MAEGQRRGLVGKGFFAFEDLEVYRLSVDFAYEVCKPVERFPDSEKYALVSQLKRAATSAMLSIAEGRGRGSDKDLAKFLFWARGSLLSALCSLRRFVALGDSFTQGTRDPVEGLELHGTRVQAEEGRDEK